MSNSVRPPRQQLTRLPHPWDSPGNNTGVGCHFLLQCMKVKSDSEVAQSCPTLSGPMDCRPPGSFVHGICQARVLEWGCHCYLCKYRHLWLFPKNYCSGRIMELLNLGAHYLESNGIWFGGRKSRQTLENLMVKRWKKTKRA